LVEPGSYDLWMEEEKYCWTPMKARLDIGPYFDERIDFHVQGKLIQY
jgi:hypothetical protein